MKYYIIAGERSGDLHAGNLIHELKKVDPDARFRGMGGDYSVEEGLSLAAHYDEVAVMGFIEVVLGFRKVLKYLALIKKDLLDYKPDALILVDYGGFNMKIAKFAKANGIVVHYFIPPKVWAWNQKRAFKLKDTVDHIYSILPFEKEFFAGFGMDIHYVGNPLLDEIAKFKPHDFFHQKNDLNYQPIISLLPGSRKQEVNNMLDTMVGVVPKFPNAQFVIAGVKNLDAVLYGPALDLGVKIVFDQTYDLLHHSTAAVVTSGTATLETALFRVPQVVVYKTSGISYAIARHLIKVPYISLVNLIAEKEVVKELIQADMNVEKVSLELNSILTSTMRKAEIYDGYTLVKERLGENKASHEVASLIKATLADKPGWSGRARI